MGFLSDKVFGQGGDGGEQAQAYVYGRGKKRGISAIDEAKRQMLYGYGQVGDIVSQGYEQAGAELSPYDIGPEALQNYQQGVEGWNQFMGPMDYASHPLYQAMLDEGMAAVNQGAAGSGALYSGARGEALRDVGQNALLGAANQMMMERGQGMDAYSQYMGGLQDLMGVGQQTSGTQADLALQRAGTGAQLAMGQAGELGNLAREKSDYITGMETGAAGAHAQNRAMKNMLRQQMYGGMAGMAFNRMGMSNPWMGQGGGGGGGGFVSGLFNKIF